MGTSWEGVKREILNRLGWRRSVPNCVGLRWLGAAVNCYSSSSSSSSSKLFSIEESGMDKIKI